MAQGLQVFDAQGNPILDTSNTVLRVLGNISVTSSGSMAVSLPPFSRFFSYMMPTFAGSYPEGSFPPSSTVGFQGGVMSWDVLNIGRASLANYRLNIFYGCY